MYVWPFCNTNFRLYSGNIIGIVTVECTKNVALCRDRFMKVRVRFTLGSRMNFLLDFLQTNLIFLQNAAKIHNIICTHTRYRTSVLIVIMLLAELIFLPVSSGSLYLLLSLLYKVKLDSFLTMQIHRWRSRNIVPNRGTGTTDTLDGRT